jgi:hypothetical protein
MKRLAVLLLFFVGTAVAVTDTAECPYDSIISAWTHRTRTSLGPEGERLFCEYSHMARLGAAAHTFWERCDQ